MSNYIGFAPLLTSLIDPSYLIQVTASTTISAQVYGKTFLCSGAGGYTLGLPALSAGGSAGILSIINDSSSSITVSSTDTIRLAGVSTNSITLAKGEQVILQNNTSTTWEAISTGTKASLVSPSLSGTPTTPTPAANDSSGQIPNTSWVTNFVTSQNLAPKASPTFTGTPIVPTISTGTDASQQVANAAFVQSAITAGATVTTGSGYFLVRFPNSRIQLLGGQFTNPTGSGTFTFPVAFPNGAMMVSCDYGAGVHSTAINWGSSTTFNAWGREVGTNSYSLTATAYFALGTY